MLRLTEQRRRRNFIAALGLTALLISGLFYLFQLRFRQGDIFPAYSSLRADPRGCRVLYESLDLLPDFRVRRSYQPTEHLSAGTGRTLLFVGMSPRPYPDFSGGKRGLVKEIQSRGGHLVIGFAPDPDLEKLDGGDGGEGRGDGPRREEPDTPDCLNTPGGSDTAANPFQDIKIRRDPRHGSGDLARRVRPVASAGLPVTLPWPGSARLLFSDPAWIPVYAIRDRAVILTRRLGEGRITLLADSYLLSNEAMRRHRRPKLLYWLLRESAGPGNEVIFDETHHGVRKQSGLAVLGRRYGLEGLAAGLMITALLFVWKSASPLTPPADRTGGENPADDSGRDHVEGLAGMLRRHIPEDRILDACISQWRQQLTSPLEHRAAALFADEKQRYRDDPVKGFRRMCELLRPPRPSDAVSSGGGKKKSG